MPEHLHEWEAIGQFVTKKDVSVWYECMGCKKRLTTPEIVHRLNATERLKGITANNAAGIIAMTENEIYLPVHDALLAYAAALEGEDDLSKLATQQKPNQEDMEGA